MVSDRQASTPDRNERKKPADEQDAGDPLTPVVLRERREKLRLQVESIPLLLPDDIRTQLKPGQQLFRKGKLTQSGHVLVRHGLWDVYGDEAGDKLLHPFELSKALSVLSGSTKIALYGHWRNLPEKKRELYTPLPPWCESLDQVFGFLRQWRTSLQQAMVRGKLMSSEESEQWLEGLQALNQFESVLQDKFPAGKVQIKGLAYAAAAISCVAAGGPLNFFFTYQEKLGDKVKSLVPMHCLEPGCLGLEDKHADACKHFDKMTKQSGGGKQQHLQQSHPPQGGGSRGGKTFSRGGRGGGSAGPMNYGALARDSRNGRESHGSKGQSENKSAGENKDTRSGGADKK
jgi:hypothetical protein